MPKKDFDHIPDSPKNKRRAKRKMKKKLSNNDDSSDEEFDTIEDFMDNTSNVTDMEVTEIQKQVSKLFPTKTKKDKNRQLKNIKKYLNKLKNKKQNVKLTIKEKSKKKKKKKIVESDDEEEEDDDEEEEEEDDDEDEDDEEDNDEEEISDALKNSMKFNIIFNDALGGGDATWLQELYKAYDEEYDPDEDEEYDPDEDEDNSQEDDYCTSDEEDNIVNKKKSKYKKGDSVEVKVKGWDKFYKGKVIKVNEKKNKEKKKKFYTYNVKLDEDDDDENEYEIVKNVRSDRIKGFDKESMEYKQIIDEFKELVKTKKGKSKKAYQQKLDKLVKTNEKREKKLKMKKEKQRKTKNFKKFRKMLREKNIMNDYNYFKKLNSTQQTVIIKKLEEIHKHTNVEKPYRLQLVEADIPVVYKANAMKKINSLEFIDPGNGEYYKIKNWVDTFMRIPFNKYNSLPISIDDGVDKCQEFMENAKKTLDNAVFGLNDAKMQIMQMVGQWISNPKSVGTAIAIQGPMGTGKTTLVKEGISKILNRPFAFLPLGGATDSSYLEGHSYTYEGSVWGKIVDILINSKSMNPVFYFDELDKVSGTPKGEEIIGILTHLTDTTQNSQFHDKYFSNIDFNLSKALFIFSYNDEAKVNSILKDRMYRIKTKGYGNKEKTTIANKYLIPAIVKNVNFKPEDIIVPDETIEYIINTYTEKEKGVRNLKRALEIIFTKINLYRLMKNDSTLFDNEKTINVEFPFTVTNDVVSKLVKKNEGNSAPFGMYL